ncbi:MAG: FAD-dependent oxidoreductase, partial [Candidatus Latescibacteria bacterium]|nr:FAD-dependent oxidoreductase [Candidatus Latescibacterota bacterium]
LYFTLWDSGQKVTSHLPLGCPTWETDDDLPMTTLHIFDSGKVEVKMKVVGFDAADGESLSNAEIHARRHMMGLIYHLQTVGYQGKKLDQHILASVSRHIGQREGRRIVGEYVLTEHDVTHAATFDDVVAVGTYHLDYHWPDKMERAGTGITTMVEPYHIPLRSLISKGSKNLLVPGRGLSGDQMAMSSYRVQATCAQTGFAAGKAAWQCIKDQSDLTTVSVSAVQQNIQNNGQLLDLSEYGDYLRHKIHTHEHIFENAPFDSCHASSLVQLPNNRILAVWFAGSREGFDDVGIWGAERTHGQWSAPRHLAKVRNDPHWNPVLFAASNGDVHLFFKVSVEGLVAGDRKRVTDGWETWRIISKDNGQTWGDAHPIVAGDTLGRGPVKNKPIFLSNGDWLAGASIEVRNTDADKPDIWDTFVDRSTDNGQTWTASENLHIDRSKISGKGVIQPTLWESTHGHIHMLTRSTEGVVYRADSTDYGQTWSSLYATSLANNNSGLDIAKLPDGTLALVCNPVTKGRHPLSVLLSQDNGQTWPHRLDIETEPGEYSYPAIIPTATGFAIAYTHNRKTVAFWHGSIEKIIK